MAFCSNCGNKVVDSAKFCHECGAAIVNIKKDESTERKREYVGSIRRCPSCGETINSFTAICPGCGHELNDTQISETLEKFIEQVNHYESMIPYGITYEEGWSSWSTLKKVGWIILNVFFIAFPVAIYLTYKRITIDSKPKLSKEEAKLVSLIENFTFPNDRESIVDAIFFIKEKVAFLSQEKESRKSLYWLRLWSSKAEQLKHKADLLFPDDVAVRQSYNEICADSEKVNKNIKTKKIIVIVLWIVFWAWGLSDAEPEQPTSGDENIDNVKIEIIDTSSFI